MIRKLLTISATLILFSCIQPKPVTEQKGFNLNAVEFSKISGFEDERNIQVAAYRYKEVCKLLYQNPAKFSKIFTDNRNLWFEKCSFLSGAKSYKEFFETHFKPYKVTMDGNDEGLFTGYYEKEISGSLTKTEKYKYPIYQMPTTPELLNLTREEINNGALNGKGLEIAYTDKLSKLFLLQVQGSGVLKTDDGKLIKLSFAGKNTHDYYSLGKYFGENNLLPKNKINSLAIEKYLDENPSKAKEIMAINKSYIFFKLTGTGPYGALGTTLKPNVSMAVDRNYIPLGSLLWLDTNLPDGKHLNHLVVAEDTGSAILGAVRGDIFFGYGKKAEFLASHMVNRGRYYLFLPKEINPDTYFLKAK
jgi:membrane-bound lytic murein transglycosylase A